MGSIEVSMAMMLAEFRCHRAEIMTFAGAFDLHIHARPLTRMLAVALSRLHSASLFIGIADAATASISAQDQKIRQRSTGR